MQMMESTKQQNNEQLLSHANHMFHFLSCNSVNCKTVFVLAQNQRRIKPPSESLPNFVGEMEISFNSCFSVNCLIQYLLQKAVRQPRHDVDRRGDVYSKQKCDTSP